MEEIEKESDSMDDNPSNEDDLDELFEQDDKQVMPAVVADPQVSGLTEDLNQPISPREAIEGEQPIGEEDVEEEPAGSSEEVEMSDDSKEVEEAKTMKAMENNERKIENLQLEEKGIESPKSDERADDKPSSEPENYSDRDAHLERENAKGESRNQEPVPDSTKVITQTEAAILSTVPAELAKEFFAIVKKGDIPNMLNMIEQYSLDIPKLVDDFFRHTALFYSCLVPDINKSYDMMKVLLEKGVPSNYADILNQTAIYYACRECKMNCVELLLDYDADINHRDQYGQTPLYYTAREGHVELAKELIRQGADVNSEDNMGQTAIFYAAREGHVEICEVFIDNGSNINKQDKRRQTPLHWAKKHNRQPVIDLLLAKGAIPPKDIFSSKKKTPKEKKPQATKRRNITKTGPKKYVLTHLEDGNWVPLTGEQLQSFLGENKELSEYINDPDKLDSITTPELNTSAGVIYDHWEKAGKRIVNHLWRQYGAAIFFAPVDPIAYDIPDYYDIIKTPMDLGTIKQKLTNNEYLRCQDFISDVELVFSNCISYNGETSEYGVVAKSVRDEFRKQYELLSLEFYMKPPEKNKDEEDDEEEDDD